MSDENIVYVESKPVMNHVLAVLNQVKEVYKDLMAKKRGRAISRAVDVAKILRNRFILD